MLHRKPPLLFLIASGVLLFSAHPVYGIMMFQQSEIENNTTNGVNTGQNKSGGGAIKTGPGSNSSIITNIVNEIETCCVTPQDGKPTPTLQPGQPTPTTAPPGEPTATPKPGDPTPTVTTQPGGGNGGNGDNGGSGGGIGGGDVSGVTTSRGEILGLAATHSTDWSSLARGLGILCLASGLLLKKRARA